MKNTVCWIGQHTLEIYILQTFIISGFLARILILDVVNWWIFHFGVSPLIAIALVLVSAGIIKIIEKSSVLYFILFGNTFYSHS